MLRETTDESRSGDEASLAPIRSRQGKGPSIKRVCFVTGTRAEFGLMQPVLRAIQTQLDLDLQLVVTGMHLDSAHGSTVEAISADGWTIDRVAPWEVESGRDRRTTARNTGSAVAALADAFAELDTDLVLIVGDRVEAFAAATAAHISGLIVAHVHGGDRAAGQVDDCLRHAISKLAHVHFPATEQSAKRLYRLGEDRWRIHRAGSPGLDGITRTAASRQQVEEMVGPLKPRRYALVVLHSVEADEAAEARRAEMLLKAIGGVPFEQIIIIYPNNDPGSGGIIRCWDALERECRPVLPPWGKDGRLRVERDVPRPVFLGLLRDAAVLVGNSSSGIIEAASFRTPVIDIGPRQKGRERGGNVVGVPYDHGRIRAQLLRVWNRGHPKRATSGNIYGGDGAGRKIADILSKLPLDERLRHKLIRY